MTDLGVLKRVDLTNKWKHEAQDFTPWLLDHLDQLSNAVGLDLDQGEREAGAGSFSVDILTKEVGSGRTVVIENQIRPTDHDHLGKLLTYAAWHEADIAIWVAAEFREEHQRALQHLNQRTNASTPFYGVEVCLLQIDDSRPAVDFRVVAAPRSEEKELARGMNDGDSSAVSDLGLSYQRFFQALTDELREKHKFTNSKVARPQNWCAFSAGITGCKYSVVFNKARRMQVELYIDGNSPIWTKAVFDVLLQDRQAIENEIGSALDWQRLDHRRASRVVLVWPDDVTLDGNHHAMLTWSIEHLLKFKAAFAHRLQDARLSADRSVEERFSRHHRVE